MNARSMKSLAVVAAVLLLGVLFLNVGSDDDGLTDNERLLPSLQPHINDVTEVSVASGDSQATIARGDEHWVVRERGNYPADTGKLRAAILALAEATQLEAKTANPERHAQLGLAGEERTEVSLAGDNIDAALVLGNVAQQSSRYARLADEEQSWLIDRNPEFPADPAEWLTPDIVDIASADMASVSIAHADGETIEITASDGGQFQVANIPEGRELSYGTVANSLAGVLQGLKLEDVRAADEDAVADVTAVLATKDGIEITVRRYAVGERHWFSFDAAVAESAPAADEAADEEVADDESPDQQPADKETAEEAPSPAARVAEINARTAGWHYRLPDYKANLLGRRWEDLLKAPEADAEE